MAVERGDSASARLAFAQVIGRIYDRILEQGCEAVIIAIAQRPDSAEKVQRLQALEILNRRVEQFAEQHNLPEAAMAGRLWATLAMLSAKTVWGHLSATAPMPVHSDTVVVVAFMDDHELMGILGLQAGWTPDLKRIDPDLDLTTTDLGGLS